eukprot:gnl/MRDRNA2_/MRDRNA2_76935_c0_seq2.p1 gnl/MRDRNA2_/MRDRNA2_76935_c0~~gnl/MRDRNA2_/MRDRNA2_76935_c0_seq2.p1  ORF type:complete len:117 (+),score=8.04 gnl/MRDRNA2_/MRDRNA2_76935_c0_seq2:247-597(+)
MGDLRNRQIESCQSPNHHCQILRPKFGEQPSCCCTGYCGQPKMDNSDSGASLQRGCHDPWDFKLDLLNDILSKKQLPTKLDMRMTLHHHGTIRSTKIINICPHVDSTMPHHLSSTI